MTSNGCNMKSEEVQDNQTVNKERNIYWQAPLLQNDDLKSFVNNYSDRAGH